MDLGTINQRLKNNYYWSAIECVKDLKTVFANCYQYNDPKEDVVSMAQTLDKIFMEKLRESPKEEIEINKFQKAPNRGRPPRYIIQDGAVLNDRIIDGFKKQQQAAGGERIVENDQRGPEEETKNMVSEEATEALPIHESSPSKWEVGFSGEVIIKAAEDIDAIYVQAVTEETMNLSDKIRKELNEYFKYSVKPSAIPTIGTFIAILLDENLYRARITDVNGEAISIFLVDFGSSSTVSLDKIRVLPDRFFEYPPCITRISLARV
jgi:hypothetical protein